MKREISLAKAAERAHQAEVICRLIEQYPDRLVDSEVSAMAALLKRLTGDVSVWLIEEQAEQEGKA